MLQIIAAAAAAFNRVCTGVAGKNDINGKGADHVTMVSMRIIALFLMAAGVTARSQESGADRVAKIQKACKEEFGPDPDAVNRCNIALVAQELQKDQDERLQSAAHAAGQ